ncbi:MAG: hypothetical protein VYC14_06100, partial [Actinomycetota bacterium]|nr:hypothetical protein [Actinomycetota bacterium]
IKDQITGLKIDVLHPNGDIQRFKDDVVYLVEDTLTNFDVLRAMSYIPAKAQPLGNTYFQAQLSNKELITTRIFSDGNVHRTVRMGRTKFNEKGHLKTFETV